MATEIRIVNAEALVVSPDEVLLLKLPAEDESDEMLDFLQETFDSLGIGKRVMTVFGDVEIAKVARADA